MENPSRPQRVPRPLELALGLCALAFSLVLNNMAGHLAERLGRNANSSPDLILNVLPLVDTTLVFVWGFAAFVLWAVVVTAWRERGRAAYIAWSYALLIMVRCFFIILTPMRLPPEAIWVEGDFLFDKIGSYMTFRHDLFFSSHTALPFLGYLLFRGRAIRLSFLFFSVLLASSVLLGRLHYSIDVFAAYFITYAVHKVEIRWFQPFYGRLKRRWLAR